MHVYPGPASNVVNMQPRTQLSSAIFIPDEMRNDILSRNEIANLVDTIPNPGIRTQTRISIAWKANKTDDDKSF